MILHRDQQNIEPPSITFYYVRTKMGLAQAWTNNQIEPLSGDPLTGFDCDNLRFNYLSTTEAKCPDSKEGIDG